MTKRRLRHFTQIVGLLVLTGVNVQADRDSVPIDVTVYVKGSAPPPMHVYFWARAAVSSMYARIGVRLAWSHGAVGSAAGSGSPLSIGVQFAADGPKIEHPGALAFALPFADGANGITVVYDRIRTTAGASGREHVILAHVLAHEIGHVLQGIDWHSQTGVMKARWDRQDFDAMQKKPLEFTPDDVGLIVSGLTAWKSQIAASTHGHDIALPSGRGSK